jgi:hypothetical protein
MLAVPVKTSFESIGHFDFLYYRDRRLCQVEACSISPSGRFAIYQGRPSGNVFLFRRDNQQITQLTDRYLGDADPFQWHEESGTVEVGFSRRIRPKTFPLQ